MKPLLYVLFGVLLSQQLAAQKKMIIPTYFISTGMFSSWSGKQMLYLDARLWENYSLFCGLGATFKPVQGSEISEYMDLIGDKEQCRYLDSPNWSDAHDVADNYASFRNRTFSVGPALSIGGKHIFDEYDGRFFFMSVEGRYLRQNIQAQRASEEPYIDLSFMPEQHQREYVNSYELLGTFGMRSVYTHGVELFIGMGFRYYNSLRLDIGYDGYSYRNATRNASGIKQFLVLGWRYGFEVEGQVR